MYSVGVSQEIFIAHSLDHPDFGPAQNVHGATLTISAEVFCLELDQMNTVIDIGKLQTALSEACSQLHYKNLDELDRFKGQLTTIDFLCRIIWKDVASILNQLAPGSNGLESMMITIKESSTAWARYSSKFE
ncbi:MAG: 6-pyruvoyl trahydropterin synthase family protein [Candidatus Kariarchaeaceae archaeon]|jgi:6-pyruvoyl-tetrahydropterin synthase